jgi:hypothetical protein
VVSLRCILGQNFPVLWAEVVALWRAKLPWFKRLVAQPVFPRITSILADGQGCAILEFFLWLAFCRIGVISELEILLKRVESYASEGIHKARQYRG